jgi:hypothetical protein
MITNRLRRHLPHSTAVRGANNSWLLEIVLIRRRCPQAPKPGADGAARSRPVCPVCAGSGFKPCGQCQGSGKNQEDKFGGSVKAGDACWLCEGSGRTMCGECVDLTDEF